MNTATNITSACNIIAGLAFAANSAIAQSAPVYSPKLPTMGYYQAHNTSREGNAFDFESYRTPGVRSQNESSPFDKFTIIDRPYVDSFLLANPEISPRLNDTYKNIKNYFPDSNLVLSISVDPDIADYEHLVVSIQVDMNPDIAIPKLYELWENWLFTDMADVRSKMIVDVEYV